MSTTKPSLRDELRAYNARLDWQLRCRYGMSLKLFKTVKAITQLAGVYAGVLAMQHGAPPLATFALITIVISGPEAVEYWVNGQGPHQES